MVSNGFESVGYCENPDHVVLIDFSVTRAGLERFEVQAVCGYCYARDAVIFREPYVRGFEDLARISDWGQCGEVKVI